MKILNLYAGIGGNRKFWDEVNPNIQVTAVEFDENIAKAYQDRFHKDEVIVGCAKEYLLENYRNFDFIWASPPCQLIQDYYIVKRIDMFISLNFQI